MLAQIRTSRLFIWSVFSFMFSFAVAFFLPAMLYFSTAQASANMCQALPEADVLLMRPDARLVNLLFTKEPSNVFSYARFKAESERYEKMPESSLKTSGVPEDFESRLALLTTIGRKSGLSFDRLVAWLTTADGTAVHKFKRKLVKMNFDKLTARQLDKLSPQLLMMANVEGPSVLELFALPMSEGATRLTHTALAEASLHSGLREYFLKNGFISPGRIDGVLEAIKKDPFWQPAFDFASAIVIDGLQFGTVGAPVFKMKFLDFKTARAYFLANPEAMALAREQGLAVAAQKSAEQLGVRLTVDTTANVGTRVAFTALVTVATAYLFEHYIIENHMLDGLAELEGKSHDEVLALAVQKKLDATIQLQALKDDDLSDAKDENATKTKAPDTAKLREEIKIRLSALSDMELRRFVAGVGPESADQRLALRRMIEDRLNYLSHNITAPN